MKMSQKLILALFTFTVVALALMSESQVEAKTALFFSQGLWDETCSELAEKFEWNCPKTAKAGVSAQECRQLCASETKPCYEMDVKSCYCCFSE